MTRAHPPIISLSGVGRLLGLAIIMAVIIGFAGYYRQDLTKIIAGSSAAANGGGGVAKRVIVYRLDRQRPTIFRFSNPVQLVRIVTQPVLGIRNPAAGQTWPYAITAELLAADGSIIATHEIHSQALYRGLDGTVPGAERFFRNSANIVAGADEVSIAVDQPVASLRIRRATSDKGIVDVDVRVYEQRPVSDASADAAFYRLSPDEQKRVASANAFPPTMLTREERVNLAINKWSPIGPQGVEGRDYQMHVVYERAREDSE
jgi:hypothetical protein